MSYNPFLPDKAAAAPTGPLTLATVGAVSAEGVTLILPGATEPTQAHYPNFSSSSLASGDSVIISRVSGTWVVMGKAGGGGGGGGGTSNYNDLSNKPSINGNTLSGNKTAAQLGLGTYSKPSGGIPKSDLASAVLSPYRTAAAQDVIDAAQDAEIGIVITGKRPSMAVTAGQFVIVRNSTISGISDGLYTANAALSPSTDVTAANLTVVSGGGLNYFTGNPTNTYITASVTTGEKISNLRAAIATVRGGLCQLYIGFDIGQAMATNELMFVLPEGFRPKTSADGLLVVTTNGGVSRTVRINESGRITAAEAFTAATYNRLVGMYFI